jgi:hypothetical protein
MYAVPKMTTYTCRYGTRATSLALESHFARAEDVFPKLEFRFLGSNIIDERGRLCTLVIK